MRFWLWTSWVAVSLAVAGLLGALMWTPDELPSLPVDRTVFLPGQTTDGHYQIELDCNACHTERFADREALQQACVDCHGAELARVDDSHPKSKFTDPRNADRVEVLDARYCVTCHQEHRPEITSTMGLSLQGDYCYRCHEDIGEDRPTHADLPFDGCAAAGCHNFHDNSALYEDFLVEHRSEPDFLPIARVATRPLGSLPARAGLSERALLAAADGDAPAALPERARWTAEWAETGHARGGVNCTDCHADASGAWVDAAPIERCAECHESEHDGFLASRHGMRVAAGLEAMRPRDARHPMVDDAADRALDCNACHGAHAYDTGYAAADACLECHADDHSLAWRDSSHARLWAAERDGDAPEGSGVSCATCHLPRTTSDKGVVRVAHNQNDFLRPNDKMIRSSCMDCHGLAFSLDSLADPALVTTNFQGRSTRKVESIHFAAVLRWELEGKPAPGRDPNQEE